MQGALPLPTAELQELLTIAQYVLMQLAQLILAQTDYTDVRIELTITHS